MEERSQKKGGPTHQGKKIEAIREGLFPFFFGYTYPYLILYRELVNCFMTANPVACDCYRAVGACSPNPLLCGCFYFF